MQLNHSLAISGFVLSVLIFFVLLGLSISLGKKIHQLTKFRTQAVALFSDRYAWLVLSFLAAFLLLFSLGCLGLFISYEVAKTDALLISFELTFLVQMILAVVFLWLMQLWGNSLLIVIKNNHLIAISDIINLQAITIIKPSKHHKFFYLHYRDEDLAGNIRQMKVRYSWQLKDFLMKNSFITKENTDD